MKRLGILLALLAAWSLASGCSTWTVIQPAEFIANQGNDTRVAVAGPPAAVMVVDDATLVDGIIVGNVKIETELSADDDTRIRAWIEKNHGIPLDAVTAMWVEDDTTAEVIFGTLGVAALAVAAAIGGVYLLVLIAIG